MKNKPQVPWRLKASIAVLVGGLFSPSIYAHTSSVGYENAGAGAVTFWYGTYHAGTNFTEGSLQVTGSNAYSSTVAFALLVTAKPAGLVDGTTNFYSDGTSLVGSNSGSTIVAWQGATFSNLSPGTYTFTYIPIATPTQTWEPIDLIILSSSVILDASILSNGGLFSPNATTYSTGAAGVLDSLVGNSTGDMSTAIASLASLSSAEQAAALQHIAPETSQALGAAAAQTVTGALDTVQLRLDGIRSQGFTVGLADELKDGKVMVATNGDLASLFTEETKKRGFWTKAFGSRGNQDMKSGFAGYDADTWGVAFGADTLLENDWVLGGAFTYANTNVNMSNFRSGDGSDIKTYQLTGYASRDFGKWYLESMLAYARQDYESSRDTTISGVAKSDFNGNQWAARANVGYPIEINSRVTLTPLAGLEWSRIRQDSYTETGAGALSLHVEGESATRVRSSLGAKLSTEVEMSNGLKVLPSMHAIWRHDFKNDGIDSTANFTGGGTSFTTPGQEIARNTYNIGGVLTFQKSKDFSLSFQLDGEKASGYSAVAGQVVGQWRF